MPLEIALDPLPHLQVVSLRGRLDSSGTPVFEDSMKEILASGEKRVLLDCSDLRYVSSVGIGVLVEVATTLRASGGGLFFAGLTQHVRSVFEMVGFFGIFQIYSSRQDALEELREPIP